VIKSKRMKWAGHVAFMGEERVRERETCTGFWWGNRGGKRTLGRPRRRWEDNIKMGLQEMVCGGMDWIEMGVDRDRWRVLVSAVMNLGVP
jgi:hypothetical protein